MAKLSGFKVDAAAHKDGAWVQPGPEYGDLEFLTRGFTDEYRDAQAARLRRAAVSLGGDPTKIPAAIQRSIMVDCVTRFVLRDVRNLEDADGQPVDFPSLCALLHKPEYPDLLTAALQAAAVVGRQTAQDVEDAIPSSVAP
jgi:hypothetical protein